MIYGLVMAAGASRRFGEIKQLAKIDGVPMALRSYNILNRVLRKGKTFLVLGANFESFGVEFEAVNIIYNRDWSLGLGSSIARAVTEIKNEKDCSGILITLVDQVRLTEHDYRKLIALFFGTKIVASDYGYKKGPPVIFAESYFEELSQLKGDSGASELLKNNEYGIVSCEISNASFDIDTKDDLKLFLSQNQP